MKIKAVKQGRPAEILIIIIIIKFLGVAVCRISRLMSAVCAGRAQDAAELDGLVKTLFSPTAKAIVSCPWRNKTG